MSEAIRVEKQDGVLSIILNRPERRNAITVAMYAAMADAIENAATDSSVRLISLWGVGEDFTAGNDLADFMQAMPAPGEGTDLPVWRFLRALVHNQVPIVATVQGNAVGIGTTMLLHCDFVVAEEGCRFVMPFVDLGLVPEAASSLILPRLAGRRAAARYLLLGDSFDAETALRIGVASHTAERAMGFGVRDRLIGALLSKPPEAMRQTQALLRKGDANEVLERMELENGHFAERLTSDEVKQAISDFFAKRTRN